MISYFTDYLSPPPFSAETLVRRYLAGGSIFDLVDAARSKDPQKAKENFIKLFDFIDTPESKKQGKNVRDLRRIIKIGLHEHKFSTTLRKLENQVAIIQFPHFLLRLGNLYKGTIAEKFVQQDLEKSKKYLDQADKLALDNPVVMASLADLLRHTRDLNGAEELLNKALSQKSRWEQWKLSKDDRNKLEGFMKACLANVLYVKDPNNVQGALRVAQEASEHAPANNFVRDVEIMLLRAASRHADVKWVTYPPPSKSDKFALDYMMPPETRLPVLQA